MVGLSSTPATLDTATPPPEVVFAVHAADVPAREDEPVSPPQLSVEALISRVASEYSISSTTLFNLAHHESRLNAEANGDGGCSRGLVQINLCVHKGITEEQALDPEWALTYAAKEIKEGREYAWSVCNCWSFIRGNYVKGLPNTAALYPNSPVKIGAVAIFNYSGVKHYAYVTNLSPGGFTVKEANYKPCVVGERFIPYTDANLLGFWSY